MKNAIKAALKNKVFWYLSSRYITYALQFITTMVIALVLGPEQFGIWSFLLIIVNFFNILDFGLPNSLSVFLVQDKLDEHKKRVHISSASVLTLVISLIVIILYCLTLVIDIPLLDKYNANSYLPLVLFVVILAYFNKVYSNVYRVCNKLLEVAIYQSAIPLILFVVVVIFRQKNLILLISSYVLGGIISLLIFLCKGEIKLTKQIHYRDLSIIASKSLWLFLYNSAFYFISYSMSLGVSIYYSVEEYGMFSFAYTISSAVILLIDSFSFVVFPKMIDKLRCKDNNICKNTINKIRVNYTTGVHLLIYTALPFFLLLTKLIDKYSETGMALCMSALALIPYSNAFGLNTYLIANNSEKILSKVSLLSLVLNILFLFLIMYVLKLPFELVYLAIMLSYIIYSFLCAKLVSNNIYSENKSFKDIFLFAYPYRQVISYIIALLCVYFSFETDYSFMILIPVIFFVIINIRDIKKVLKTTKSVLYSPTIVDLDNNE